MEPENDGCFVHDERIQNAKIVIKSSIHIRSIDARIQKVLPEGGLTLTMYFFFDEGREEERIQNSTNPAKCLYRCNRFQNGSHMG